MNESTPGAPGFPQQPEDNDALRAVPSADTGDRAAEQPQPGWNPSAASAGQPSAPEPDTGSSVPPAGYGQPSAPPVGQPSAPPVGQPSAPGYGQPSAPPPPEGGAPMAMPVPLTQARARGAAPVQSLSAPSGAAGPGYPPTSGAWAAPAAEAAPAAPMDPRTKKRILLTLGALAAALVLVVGGVIAVGVIRSAVFGPEKQVEAYLDHLQKGDFSAAVDLAPPNVATGQRLLLTDAIGKKAEKRISAHSIDDVEVDGDHAKVKTTLTQDGVRSERTFSLTKKGTKYLFFPEWTIDAAELGTVEIIVPDTLTTVKINGADVDLSKAEPEAQDEGAIAYSLPAMPGTLSISAASSSEFIDIEDSSMLVPADSKAGRADPLTLNPQLNSKGEEEIRRQISVKLESCAKATTAEPQGCPFRTYVPSDSDKGTWKITKQPEVTIDQSGVDEWSVSTSWDQRGEASFSYKYKLFADSPEEARTGTASIAVRATARLTDDGKLSVEFEE